MVLSCKCMRPRPSIGDPRRAFAAHLSVLRENTFCRIGFARKRFLTLQPEPENHGQPASIPQKIVATLPSRFQKFAKLSRWDKPIGTWLLYSPCTWSITMAAFVTAAPLSHTLYTLGLFGVGAFITRGAGCTINDLYDRKLDRKVARTMLRPLAAGDVTVPQAVSWLAVQCFAGLGILFMLPPDCWLLGAAAMIPVSFYPAFKRFTYYPQAVLSSCFTWGALLGFTAMGMTNWPAMLSLYGSAYAWCMIYDTVYAHQDKKYDVTVGIKSTALKWGDRSKHILKVLELIQVSLLTLSGLLLGMGPGFYTGVAAATWRLRTSLRRVDLDHAPSCWNWFVDNIRTGHIIWAGTFTDYVMRLCGLL